MTKYITTKDIVVPAGTDVGIGPAISAYFTDHGEILIGFDKNTSGKLSFDLQEAKLLGIIEPVDPVRVIE